MRASKNIDPSLKKKIVQNDEKLRILYDKEVKRGKSLKKSSAPNRNKKDNQSQNQNNDNSFSEIMMKKYNDKDVSPATEEINSKISKTMTIDNDDKNAFVSRMQKRMKFKKDKEEKKNNTIFCNTFSNVYKNLEDKKKKKTYNKDQVDKVVNRLYNNEYKHRKQPVKEEEFIKTKDENEADVEEFIERLEEDLQRRNKNLEKKKK